ncbi:MAG: hypothetical protein Q8880_08200 [Bacteroidota bacterium]|nr:hypothetical protein [Bacteroidota bacterium]
MIFQRINTHEQTEKQLLNTLFFTSLISFIISYIVVFFLFICSFAVAASFFDLAPMIKYPLVNFTHYDIDWDITSVTVVYTSGAIFSLICGLIFNSLYLLVRNKSKFLQLFILWGMLHSYSIFLGHIIHSPDQYSYLGCVGSWHHIHLPIKWFFAVIAMIMLIVTGILNTMSFFRVSYSNRLVQRKSMRINYMFYTVFFPFVIGSITCFIYNWPPRGTLMILLPFCYSLIIITMMLYSTTFAKIKINATESPYVITKFGVAVAIICIIALRIYLLTPIWF